ncbi:hypothetical protein GCM10020255_083710 [Rhodococcus baikonurensis]
MAEPMAPGRIRIPQSLRPRAVELLRRVGLGADLAERLPTQLSGGQRQRVTIARALASQAPLILCDEPVASLDVSLQEEVLRLLADLREEHDLTYIFISHDLGSVARIADRVAVMYLGRIVEIGPVATVLRTPSHPYTQALLAAAPHIDLERRSRRRHWSAESYPIREIHRRAADSAHAARLRWIAARWSRHCFTRPRIPRTAPHAICPPRLHQPESRTLRSK